MNAHAIFTDVFSIIVPDAGLLKEALNNWATAECGFMEKKDKAKLQICGINLILCIDLTLINAKIILFKI